MSMQTYYLDPMDPKNLEYGPNYNFHDWCVERELKALDHAWEIQVIYEKRKKVKAKLLGNMSESDEKEGEK